MAEVTARRARHRYVAMPLQGSRGGRSTKRKSPFPVGSHGCLTWSRVRSNTGVSTRESL